MTTALSTPNPLALITDDMREVDHVIAQRLTTTVPLIAQISHYCVLSWRRLRRVFPAAGFGIKKFVNKRISLILEPI